MKNYQNFSKNDTQPNINVDEQEKIYKKIGPYQIDSFFSKGGMGILYLAHDPKEEKFVILKILPPKFFKNKNFQDNFLKEAQIISKTDHPNIIKLYSHGKWEQGLYIAMEFVNGITLKQFIEKKSLSKKRVLEIILQVAYALLHLHSLKIIHRDIKPENILITENGNVKIVDFGIAKFLDEESSEFSKIIGTLAYMSPEQRKNPSGVKFSSDIYSLGIILYELILGKFCNSHVNLSHLPKNLKKIINKATAVDPKNRYSDCSDFIFDLTNYLRNHLDENKKNDIEDFSFFLEKTQNLLTHQNLLKIPAIEIGVSKSETLSHTSIYLDSFKLQNDKYIIVLAEPKIEDFHSFYFSSTLRGMMRMHIENFSNEKYHPITFLNSLNSAILKDFSLTGFAINFLSLDLRKNQISFISCGHDDIFHIPSKSKKILSLSTPNNFLGLDNNNSIVETASNFNIDDKIVMFSQEIIASDTIEDKKNKKNELKNLINDYHLLQVDKLANKLLKKIEFKSFGKRKRTSLIICLQRVI